MCVCVGVRDKERDRERSERESRVRTCLKLLRTNVPVSAQSPLQTDDPAFGTVTDGASDWTVAFLADMSDMSFLASLLMLMLIGSQAKSPVSCSPLSSHVGTRRLQLDSEGKTEKNWQKMRVSQDWVHAKRDPPFSNRLDMLPSASTACIRALCVLLGLCRLLAWP